MKISYKHLVDRIESKPSLVEMSEILFQLGHEHEIEDEIFDIEFTPNRGDCLSLNGLLRDLMPLCNVNSSDKLYDLPIDLLDLDFVNEAKQDCPHISFLRIDLPEDFKIDNYKNELNSYFKELNINKNNFFADISNYISYETGQPTHCYDLSKINSQIKLQEIHGDHSFETLLGKKINLTEKNLVFLDGEEIINLAGVMGGKNSSCSGDTFSVLVECGYFDPEKIIGKSLKYDLVSDSAHKFERFVDPYCHEKVLRRFLYIVNEHVEIKNVEIFCANYKERETFSIEDNINKINNIIGTSLDYKHYKTLLSKLGFIFENGKIQIPSYRSDVRSHNDLAEEIARLIGYNNITSKQILINNKKNIKLSDKNKESYIKKFLSEHGFFEVINNPFSSQSSSNLIKIDNPLDSSKSYIRDNLKESLLNNLLYNERRQQDSIKLFEISNVYNNSDPLGVNKFVGVIVSGRIGKNYLEFSKKINSDYLKDILKKRLSNKYLIIEEIQRRNLDSKSNNPIFYIEFELDKFINNENDEILNTEINFDVEYKTVSDYPMSIRDLSFSVKEPTQLIALEKLLLNLKNCLLKEVYIFDFFVNEKKEEVKIGFRFVFQSYEKTLTDKEINEIMDDIIDKSMKIESVNIPGL